MLAIRMKRDVAALLWVLAAGCFAPRYEEGIQCSEANTCPPGMTCDPTDNRCWYQPRYECRADDDCASGDCDQSSGRCVEAVCGDGVVNQAAGEVCDPGRDACCAATCDALMPAGTACRPSAGSCDPAEVCDGANPACPSDAMLPDGNACSGCASGLCGTCMAGVCQDLLCGNGIVDTIAGEQCEPDDDAACPGGCTNTCTCAYAGSCREHLAAVPDLPDGIYTIDPDGGAGAAPFQVYCDMTSDGGGWTRVFHEDTGGGDFFLRDDFELNKSDPEAGLYAILNDLERFRRDGEFELLMRWPGHATYTADQHWAQTSNPVTDSPGAIPTGYRAISVPYTSQGWSAGLQRSLNGDSSLLDGTISPLSNWYYAVGTTYCWGNQTSGCQPAPSGGAHIVELLVR